MIHCNYLLQLFSQKKASVPFFNSGASLLEPIRGSDLKKDRRGAGSPLPTNEGKPEAPPPAAPSQVTLPDGKPNTGLFDAL